MSSPSNPRRGIAKQIKLRPVVERLEARQLLASDLAQDYDIVSPAWYERLDIDQKEIASIATGQSATEWFSQFVGPRRYVKSDWIVRLSQDTTQSLTSFEDAVTRLNQSNIHFRVVAGLGLPGLVHVSSLSLSELAVRDTLSANDAVVSFSKNERVSGQVLPNDSDFGNMTSLHNVGQFGATNDADIDAPEAWDVTRGSTNVVVGVIDSGVDPTHPDLYLNIWLNQGEIPDALRPSLVDTDSDGLISFYDLNASANSSRVRDRNANSYIDAADLLDDPLWADGRDTDGNGFTDDFFGWNFRNDANEVFAPNNPSDNLGHGTHVAGTIGAIGNNARGVTGVNWRSSIMSLKFLDESNQGDLASAIAAVNYATMMRSQFQTNVRVLNNSWGQPGGFNPLLKNTIDAAGNAGILFVAAAGNGNILGSGVDNDRNPFYPASYESDNIISVAASDATDRLAPFSNFGLRSVDIAAPGVGVRSTLPGGRYGEANGTSMATPHVAGAAALVWSLQTEASVAEIRRALLEQGDVIPPLGSQISTSRRLNANKSLAADVFAPTVQLVSAANITTAGGTEQLITVKYKNRLGVDKVSLGNNDLIVTRQASLDETLATSYVSLTENPGKTEVTAIYRLSAVGGTWDAEDYGNYVITAKSDASRSLSGLASRETTLGSFQVKIAAANIFYVDTFLDTVDANVGNGQAKDSAGRTSLRAAIQEANALKPQPVKIFLETGTYPLTIASVIDAGVNYPVPPPGSGYEAPTGLQWSNATSGDLDLQGNITLVGLGVNRTTIDAAGIDRVMKVYPGATVSMTGLTLTGGKAPTDHSGGAILNSGNLSLDLVTIKNNEATGGPVSLGGGIAHWNGNLNLYRSTLDSNQAIGGGGVFVTNGATAKIDSSTLEQNVADAGIYPIQYQQGGGGILTSTSGLVNVVNSTLLDNAAKGIAIGDAVRNNGRLFDERGQTPSISGNGQFVVFRSYGSISPVDNDGQGDIYIFDRQTELLELVSVNSSGSKGNGGSNVSEQAASSDGRYVVFDSVANNLDLNDDNQRSDVFLRDRLTNSTLLISRALDGGNANGSSAGPHISADGRFVVFNSGANNLVPGDTNDVVDTFVYEIATGHLERVNVSNTGEQANGATVYAPNISGDGRFVAWETTANNLDTGDNNDFYDVYIRDRLLGTTKLVSRAMDGLAGNGESRFPSLSFDGGILAYTSAANNLVPGDTTGGGAGAIWGRSDTFIYNVFTSQTTMITPGLGSVPANGTSLFPMVSGNGRYIAFISWATDFLSNDTNNLGDVIRFDRVSGTFERVVPTGINGLGNGTYAACPIDFSGNAITYMSEMNQIVPGDNDSNTDVFVMDFSAPQTTLITKAVTQTDVNAPVFGRSTDVDIDSSGRYLAFTSFGTEDSSYKTTDVRDLYIRDDASQVNSLISLGIGGVKSNGNSSTPRVSADGRFVVFRSLASNLVANDDNGLADLFLYDRQNNLISRILVSPVGQQDASTFPYFLSADGTQVVFETTHPFAGSGDSNGQLDVYVLNLGSNELKWASRGLGGIVSNGPSMMASISGDGRWVSFVSGASNLIAADSNGVSDVFQFELATLKTTRISVAPSGAEANGASGSETDRAFRTSTNADGRFVAFSSLATNLVENDTNFSADVFLYDRLTNSIQRTSIASDGKEVDGASGAVAISADGRFLIFRSSSVELDPRSGGYYASVFIYDNLTASVNRIAYDFPSSQSVDLASFSQTIQRFAGQIAFVRLGSGTFVYNPLTGSQKGFTNYNSLRPVPLQLNYVTIAESSIQEGSWLMDKVAGEFFVTNSILPKTVDDSLPVTRSQYRNAFIQDSVFLAPADFQQSQLTRFGTRFLPPSPLSIAIASANPLFGLTADQSGAIRNRPFDAGAAELRNGSITGVAFADRDGNGVRSAGEELLRGVELFIDSNGNNLRDASEPTTETSFDNPNTIGIDESGMYRFADVLPGRVSIAVNGNDVMKVSLPSTEEKVGNRSVDLAGDLSADGELIVFASTDQTLTVGDTNGKSDVFAYDKSTGSITRVSINISGGQANGNSTFPATNSSGRFVAYQSEANNLVAGDTNGKRDVFIFDRQTGVTTRVSVGQGDVEGNGDTQGRVFVSDDGSKVAFISDSSNLTSDDNNNRTDLFVRDLASGLTKRLPFVDPVLVWDDIASVFQVNASFSRDLTKLIFSSSNSTLVSNDNNGAEDVFVADVGTGSITLISKSVSGGNANGASSRSTISGDGMWAVFTSSATNLVSGDSNSALDLFLANLSNGQVSILSTPQVTNIAAYRPSLDFAGEYVVFRRAIPSGYSRYLELVRLDIAERNLDSVRSEYFTSTTTPSVMSGIVSGNGASVLISDKNGLSIWDANKNQGKKVRTQDGVEAFADIPIQLALGTISGRVFEDSISNLSLDVGEKKFSTWTVFVDEDRDYVLDSSEARRTTDQNGEYRLAGLQSEREYSIVAIPAIDAVQVVPRQALAWQVYLPAGANITDRDFGFVKSTTGGQFENATLTGRLFNDLNGDGLIQSGESGLVGITVYLDLNGNETRDFNEPRTVTDANGNYSFASLGNRAYTVRTILPTGTVQTSPLGSKFASTALLLTTGSTQLANPQDVLAEDFNNDGWADIAVALFSGNSVSLRLNDGAGNFTSTPINVSTAPDGLGPIALAAGRLNAGTAIDLITANQLNGTATILRDFNGTGFASRQTLAVGQTPTDVILGRFDNDEDLDAVVANKSTDQLTLLVNNGSGVFTKGPSFSSGGKNPTALVTGLFNNDTFPDIAVTNYGTHPTGGDFGNVAVLLGRGDGTFHTAVPYTVGFGPISIASGDFNGDGFADLVTANFLANTASVLLGSSSGAFTVVTEALGVGQGPLQVSTGDIEGDGDLDVLVTNLLSQSISVIRNRRSQGGTGFEPAESFGVAEFQTSPRLAFANADFDRNTTTDIALVNSLSDSLKILRNNLVNGAHRIQLTGVETVAGLNFGTRPDVLLPTMNPISNPESIVEDAPQQIVPLSGIALGRTGGPALRITATSSDTNVIPNPTINYVAGQSTGELRFTPNAHRSGQVTMTVTARDAGADRLLDTADDGVLSRLFTVTIKPVNDSPNFAIPRLLNLLEDSAAQTLVGFATGISEGPFETQTLSAFTVSNDRPALFAVPPSIDASGTLRFTPASNAVGTAVVSVTLTDNGDTAYGGSNLRTDTFLIAIDAVNDAPSITIGGNQTVQVAANRQTLNNFATGFNPGGGSDEASQSIAGFVVTVDKPELFSELPAISNTGTLTYTPSATRTGTAIVTVRVRDSGGSLNSGIDLSAASTFNIVVSPLPDTTPPTPVLTTTAATIGNSRSFDVGIDFGESVTGLTLSDFVLVNATTSELVDQGMGRYTVRVTAVNDGQVSVSLPAAAVRDLANNNSLVSNVLSRTVDTAVPTAVLSTNEPNPTTRSSFPFTIQFSEPVIGFEISDLVLLNATVSNWAEPTPGRFTATLNASTDGAVLVGFSSGAARDPAGNFNSTPSPLIVSVNTGAANYKPLLSTTEPAITSNKNWTAVIDFGRVVTGFEANDLVLTNASATITSLGSGRFQINVTSVNEGTVTIQLPADRVRDTNNHPNQASDPLTLQFVDTTNSDFGDAPLPYPTRLQENGAYHKRTTLFLGTSVDAEPNGQPSALANGDDSAGSDDEEGVTWGTTLMVSPLVTTTASVVVTSSGAGFLDAWIDYNQDGDWSDSGEQIANKVAVVSGKNAISFAIPSTTLVGTTFARFRLSSVGGLAPTGKANDGEVEDYQVSLVGGTNKVLDLRLSELTQYAFTVTNGSLVVTTGTKTIWSAPLSELGSVNAWDAAGQKRLAWSPVSALPGVIEISSAPWQVSLVASGNIPLGSFSNAIVGINTIDLRTANRQNLVFQQRDVEAINTDKKLRIRMGADDTLQTSSAWRIGAGRVENGLWIQSYVSGASTIEVQDALAWRNSVSTFDMDGDTTVSPLDVLHLVNAINNGTFGDGNLPVRNATHPAGFFDIDGDSRITPLDVLGLINVLNNQSAGEGESPNANAVDQVMIYDFDEIISRRRKAGIL